MRDSGDCLAGKRKPPRRGVKEQGRAISLGPGRISVVGSLGLRVDRFLSIMRHAPPDVEQTRELLSHARDAIEPAHKHPDVHKHGVNVPRHDPRQ
jgi:hypothetical protein